MLHLPNPDSVVALDPWFSLAALGVRVDLLASGEIGSGPWYSCLDMVTAKRHEAWALADLGPVESKAHIKRIKYAFVRACYRSLNYGSA